MQAESKMLSFLWRSMRMVFFASGLVKRSSAWA
jgi:hypothetical protein